MYMEGLAYVQMHVGGRSIILGVLQAWSTWVCGTGSHINRVMTIGLGCITKELQIHVSPHCDYRSTWPLQTCVCVLRIEFSLHVCKVSSLFTNQPSKQPTNQQAPNPVTFFNFPLGSCCRGRPCADTLCLLNVQILKPCYCKLQYRRWVLSRSY